MRSEVSLKAEVGMATKIGRPERSISIKPSKGEPGVVEGQGRCGDKGAPDVSTTTLLVTLTVGGMPVSRSELSPSLSSSPALCFVVKISGLT